MSSRASEPRLGTDLHRQLHAADRPHDLLGAMMAVTALQLRFRQLAMGDAEALDLRGGEGLGAQQLPPQRLKGDERFETPRLSLTRRRRRARKGPPSQLSSLGSNSAISPG